jgi:hypothetical protein
MLALGKSLLMFNKVDTLGSIYSEIEKITTVQLFNIANEVFEENNMNSLIFE